MEMNKISSSYQELKDLLFRERPLTKNIFHRKMAYIQKWFNIVDGIVKFQCHDGINFRSQFGRKSR